VLDHKKLAVIHIVKKELGLSDQEYRDALERITGVRSAKELDEPGFRTLMRHFAKSRHYRVNAKGLTFRQQLFIKHLVEDLGWDQNHFHNFLRKYYHQETLTALSRSEASKVIESLKQILAHRPPPA
jgi:hypothetical protein